MLRLVAPIVALSLLAALLSHVWTKYIRKPVADGPEDEAYKVYTREFDLILPAHEVLARLGTASPDSGRNWLTRVELSEPASQVGAPLADERGTIAALRSAACGLDPADIVVTILVDQSGSMRGVRVENAAVTVALLAALLGELGARSEVLGFSTAGWRGGFARLKWLKEGRPKRPGRLAALMHLIYKSADETGLSEEARRVMVHPDLLRENIDGEAIRWAWERLAARPERIKILIVISDGAPVDDSTLAQNGPSYLYRDLKRVLAEMSQQGSVILGGIGVEHRIESFYPLSETAETPGDLPRAGVKLLERLIAEAGHRQQSTVE